MKTEPDFYSADFLSSGMDTLEKAKNFAIDTFIDYSIGSVPLPNLVTTGISYLAETPINKLKEAAHQATAFQKPATFSHLPSSSAPFLEINSKQIVEFLNSSSLPGRGEPLPIAIPKGASAKIKHEILKENLKLIGLSEKAREQAMASVTKLSEIGIVKANEAIINARAGASIPVKATAEQVQQVLNVMSEGAKGIIQLGELLDCRELRTVGKMVEIGIQVYQVVSSVKNLSMAIGMVGPLAALGPIGLAAGVVVALVSIFSSSGPNPTEIILRQIGRLSEQLSRMHQDVMTALGGIRADQARMLEILTHGLASLHKDLGEKIVGLRVDFNAVFNRLRDSLDYLSDLTLAAAKNQYLQPMYQYCSQSDLLSLSEGSIARQITKGLETWLVADSKNEILTGQIVWRSSPSLPAQLKLLERALGGDEVLCGLLGFLIPGKTMVNPLIWHQVTAHYIAHTRRFFAFYMEAEDSVLEKAIKLGEEQQEILHTLSVDKGFWQNLIGEYYGELKQVLSCQDECVTAYDESRRDYYNRQYLSDRLVGHGDRQNQPLAELKILNPPADLIGQFDTRSVQHLRHPEHKISGRFEDYPWPERGVPERERLFDISLERVFTTLKDLPLSPADRNKLAALLCAEYLELVNFSARAANVPYPEISFTKDAWEGDGHPEEGIIRDIVQKGRGPGVHYLRDQASRWTLPVSLVTNDTEIVNLTYEGHYQHLPEIDGIWNQSISRGQGHMRARYRYSDPGGDGGFHHKLRWEIPRYLGRQWQGNQGQCIRFEIADNPRIGSRSLNESINEACLNERRRLVGELCSFRGQGHRQALLNNYELALVRLDIAVSKLKLYAHLLGKRWTVPLLTAENIRQEMRQQMDRLDQSDLTPHLSAAVKLLATQRIQMNDLRDLKELKPYHPLSLLNETLRCLRAHAIWRKLTRLMHPELRYINIQHYWADRSFAALERMREENYAQFSELREITAGFRRAKGIVNNPKISPMLDQYRATREAILEWILDHARHPNVTGYVERTKDLKLVVSDTQKLRRDWEYNIAFLFQLAASKGLLPSMKPLADAKQLVNFKLWADGCVHFLRLLDYQTGSGQADGFALAKKAGYSLENQVSALENMFKSGLLLHRTINAMALSPQLFTQIFDGYLDTLGLIQSTIDYYKSGSSPQSDAEIFLTLTSKNLPSDPLHVGNYLQIKDKLEESRCLIVNYVHMAFNNEEFSSLSGKMKSSQSLITGETDKLTQYLSNESKSYADYPLQKRLQDYSQQVQDIKQKVLQRVEYANNLQFFAQCLENYFKDNWPCNTLIITPQFCTARNPGKGETVTFSFDVDHIDIISQFLKAYPHIRSVTLCQIPLNNSLLESLVVCIRSHPSVVHLRLLAARLQGQHLVVLKPLLSQLQTLDLSANCLGEQGADELYPLISFIQDAQNKSVRQLVLTENRLEGLGAAAIKAAFRSMPTLDRSLSVTMTGVPEIKPEPADKSKWVAPAPFRAKISLDIGQSPLKCLLSLLFGAYVRQRSLMQGLVGERQLGVTTDVLVRNSFVVNTQRRSISGDLKSATLVQVLKK